MADEDNIEIDGVVEAAEGALPNNLPQEVTNRQIEVSRDTSDPAYVKEQKRQIKRRKDHEIADLLFVMNDYSGRAFIWRLLGECGIYTASFPDNDRLLNFDQGRRTIGLNLQQACVEADSQLFNRMRDEAIERDKREAKT